MTPRLPHDPDAITRAQAAAILGVAERTVARWRREGLLVEQRGGRRLYSRTEAEGVAANPWLTGVQAAEILGVSHVRVSQLAEGGKIPVHVTRSGQRVYRKAQIEVVANARQVRAHLREGMNLDTWMLEKLEAERDLLRLKPGEHSEAFHRPVDDDPRASSIVD